MMVILRQHLQIANHAEALIKATIKSIQILKKSEGKKKVI